MKRKLNDISVNYEIFGNDGPWVVLSHSLMCDLTMWGPQIDVLKADYRVLAYDTRGHGGTDAPDGEYTLDELASDAYELLAALDIHKPHWVGLSMGGMIGMTAALNYPNLFSSLVLCDTTSRIPEEMHSAWKDRIRVSQEKGMASLVSSTLERWFTDDFRAEPRPELRFVSNLIESTPVAGFVGCCHAIPKINCTSRLHEIKEPIKIIVGKEDVGTPVKMSEEIHAASRESSLTVLDNASHLSNLEQPQQFNEALLSFLSKN